ncbi:MULTISPECIES: hypothetical protein [unclassified Bosea (in: a-proteobacteria)]|uniref:hypothetical protein n=1 Tax=unclassified Bosea (in: a-proteobacteria) TaxID=2653178 RepID=UPI00125EDD87|nr:MULTISPECIES: hypothetical protein [unclassified Bosea (in: a-proteobacteria)]
MNRHQRLADYLRHMFDAARKSGVYIDGMEKADFMADRRALAGGHCRRRGEAMIIITRQPDSPLSTLQFPTLVSSICRSC